MLDEQQTAAGDLDGFLERLTALAEDSGVPAGDGPLLFLRGPGPARPPLRGEEIAQTRAGLTPTARSTRKTTAVSSPRLPARWPTPIFRKAKWKPSSSGCCCTAARRRG